MGSDHFKASATARNLAARPVIIAATPIDVAD
jgi:hypothetical protein